MVFRGEAYYSDTDYPAADECLDVKIGTSIATEVYSFWQINVFHQNWIAEKFPISINWRMFTSGVSQPHTLSTASVALVQTDTMIQWVFGRLVWMQQQRHASHLLLLQPPLGPHRRAQRTSSLHAAAMLDENDWQKSLKKMFSSLRFLLGCKGWAMAMY